MADFNHNCMNTQPFQVQTQPAFCSSQLIGRGVNIPTTQPTHLTALSTVDLSELLDSEQNVGDNLNLDGRGQHEHGHVVDDDQMDEILIEEVQKYRILWDTSTRGYKDTIKKNQAWSEISAKLNNNADVLKRRWKNLRDGMMRCLKRIKESQKSGAGASKTPTCKFFDKLLFLKDFVSNRETVSNIVLPNDSINTDSGSNMSDDSGSVTPPPSTSTPGYLPFTKSNHSKRNLANCDMDKGIPYHPPKRQGRKSECQEKIDLLLVDALSKSDEQKTVAHETKSSNHLFCDSIVEILDKLPSKKNRMARVEIQQVLMKYEFDED